MRVGIALLAAAISLLFIDGLRKDGYAITDVPDILGY